jgi:hypothetical protein
VGRSSGLERQRREEKRRESGEILRDTTFEGREETVSPVLKVPRQCAHSSFW